MSSDDNISSDWEVVEIIPRDTLHNIASNIVDEIIRKTLARMENIAPPSKTSESPIQDIITTDTISPINDNLPLNNIKSNQEDTNQPAVPNQPANTNQLDIATDTEVAYISKIANLASKLKDYFDQGYTQVIIPPSYSQDLVRATYSRLVAENLPITILGATGLDGGSCIHYQTSGYPRIERVLEMTASPCSDIRYDYEECAESVIPSPSPPPPTYHSLATPPTIDSIGEHRLPHRRQLANIGRHFLGIAYGDH